MNPEHLKAAKKQGKNALRSFATIIPGDVAFPGACDCVRNRHPCLASRSTRFLRPLATPEKNVRYPRIYQQKDIHGGRRRLFPSDRTSNLAGSEHGRQVLHPAFLHDHFPHRAAEEMLLLEHGGVGCVFCIGVLGDVFAAQAYAVSTGIRLCRAALVMTTSRLRSFLQVRSNVIMVVSIVIIPMQLLWRLHLPLSKKLGGRGYILHWRSLSRFRVLHRRH